MAFYEFINFDGVKNMRNTAKYLAVLLCMGVSGIAGCAMQEDLLVVHNRVLALESWQKQAIAESKEINDRLDKTLVQWEADAGILRENVAEMRAATDSLRNEIRSFHGMLEEHGFQLQKQVGTIETTDSQAREDMTILEARINSMRDTLLRVEAFLGMETGQQAQPQQQPDKGPKPTDLDENETYAHAKKTFDQGKLETARDEFRAFLARFPNSKNADNALFWVGESFFQEKWYSKAIMEYQQVIEKYPTANKVPGACLKQGMAFSMLNDNPSARAIWMALIEKYPDTPEAVIAKKKIDGLKLTP